MPPQGGCRGGTPAISGSALANPAHDVGQLRSLLLLAVSAACLTRAQATNVAQMARGGLAVAIRVVHTM